MSGPSGASAPLPDEWEQCLAALLEERDASPTALSDEEWRVVLEAVLRKMEALGFVPQLGWQAQLAALAGRSAGQRPESHHGA